MHALYPPSGSLVKLSLDKTTVVLDELLESVHVTGTLQQVLLSSLVIKDGTPLLVLIILSTI